MDRSFKQDVPFFLPVQTDYLTVTLIVLHTPSGAYT